MTSAAVAAWRRSKFGDWWADEPEPMSGEVDACCELEPGGIALCTRAVGHRGRHMATAAVGTVVLVAWPGEHEPTEAELTASTALVLWAPVVHFNEPYGPPAVPEIRYRPPRDTCDPRYVACRQHRVACDCREAHMAEDRKELRAYADQARKLEQAADAVLALHRMTEHGYCSGCSGIYPCPTRNLLAPLSWRERFEKSREDS